MEHLRRFFRASDIYQQHGPLLKLLQVCGVVPFVIRGNRPQPTKLSAVYFLAQTASIIYCLYDTKTKDDFSRMSRFTLTVVLYDTVALIGTVHIILVLLRFLLKAKASARMWTALDAMDATLAGVGAAATKWKTWSAVKASAFLLAFAGFVFVTYNLQTDQSRLTFTFWTFWYLPLFQKWITDLTFHVYCFELKRMFSVANRILLEDVVLLRGGRRRHGTLRRVRQLRGNHFRGYTITQDMESLFGVHFLLLFVCYFVTGTLDFCNIIRLRKSRNPSSVVRYKSAVYWTIMETSQLLSIVGSATLLRREVHRMVPLVHEYLLLTDDDDVHMKQELETFILQMQQCPIIFTASGFFHIDCSLLLKMCVAIISNALFFVQIDKLKQRS